MSISVERANDLIADREIVEYLYWKACNQYGKDAVDADFTRLWDLRCGLGMAGRLPFGGGMRCKNLEDVLFVAREICSLPHRADEVFARFGV